MESGKDPPGARLNVANRAPLHFPRTNDFNDAN